MQWSRRFIGLKLFLSLASIGLDGYRRHVERTFDLTKRLRDGLVEKGWEVPTDGLLAVLCCVPPNNASPAAVAKLVTQDGDAWVSTTRFEGRDVLRTCITSHFTTAVDIDRIVRALDDAATTALKASKNSRSA